MRLVEKLRPHQEGGEEKRVDRKRGAGEYQLERKRIANLQNLLTYYEEKRYRKAREAAKFMVGKILREQKVTRKKGIFDSFDT